MKLDQALSPPGGEEEKLVVKEYPPAAVTCSPLEGVPPSPFTC